MRKSSAIPKSGEIAMKAMAIMARALPTNRMISVSSNTANRRRSGVASGIANETPSGVVIRIALLEDSGIRWFHEVCERETATASAVA